MSTVNDMTPQQAADLLDAEAWWINAPRLNEALRVLIDHARAAAPESEGQCRACGRVVDLVMEMHEARVGGHQCAAALGWEPAPSIAAPPREDREALFGTADEALPPEFLIEDDAGNLHAPPPPDDYIRPPS